MQNETFYPLFEPLEWDSDLFGYRVARVVLEREPSDSEIEQLQGLAAEKRMRLVYLSWPCVTSRLQARKGLSYIGTKVEFERNLQGCDYPKIPDVSICRNLTEPIRNLALESGKFSRFHSDSNFTNGEFRLLYDRWIENAFYPSGSSSCLVYGSPDDPDGLITLERPPETGRSLRIGLLAIHRRARRGGFGRRLVQAAMAVAASESRLRMLVATQGENGVAMSFYAKVGFHPVTTTAIAHMWI